MYVRVRERDIENQSFGHRSVIFQYSGHLLCFINAFVLVHMLLQYQQYEILSNYLF